jgi:DNA invertase Pin-like site-specific DNA recombinase
MEQARLREFDVVLVWKFDRFARSLRELLEALEKFGALGIEFVSLKDQCDTTTSHGKLLFQIMGAVAEFERSLINERVRAGVKAAREKLKRGPYTRRRNGRDVVISNFGRPRKEINENALMDVKLGKQTLRDLARKLGVSPSTVLRRLRASDPAPVEVSRNEPGSGER